jgi:hypothetical protein
VAENDNLGKSVSGTTDLSPAEAAECISALSEIGMAAMAREIRGILRSSPGYLAVIEAKHSEPEKTDSSSQPSEAPQPEEFMKRVYSLLALNPQLIEHHPKRQQILNQLTKHFLRQQVDKQMLQRATPILGSFACRAIAVPMTDTWSEFFVDDGSLDDTVRSMMSTIGTAPDTNQQLLTEGETIEGQEFLAYLAAQIDEVDARIEQRQSETKRLSDQTNRNLAEIEEALKSL